MPVCPVCEDEINADDLALNHHVNSHFTQISQQVHSPATPYASEQENYSLDKPLTFRESANNHEELYKSNTGIDDGCMVCGYPLGDLNAEQRRTHVNACLDEQNAGNRITGDTAVDGDYDMEEGTMQTMAQDNGDDWVELDWDGPAKPGGWADWVNKKVGRGDKWWDPISGPSKFKDIPTNISPYATEALCQLLRTSSNRTTRRAVLCSDTAHMRHSFQLDLGWGCGYRNALMIVTALLLARPQYRKVFSRDMNGADPGVRRLQGWVEEGWREGFDREGSGHFRGRLLGTRKWIGTSDLYAMFSAKGIPCELYDFPKPKTSTSEGQRKPANAVLIDWVKKYFAEDSATTGQTQSAFDMLMRANEGSSGRGETIRKIRKLPLILQHAGHSRTIVGYEETTRGTINLFLFDPGRWLPKDIRVLGIDHIQVVQDVSQMTTPPRTRKQSDQSVHEPISFTRPYTNGASEPTDVHEADPSEIQQDEEEDANGWVRKKVKKVLRKTTRNSRDDKQLGVTEMLSHFRVSSERLGKFKEYQVLAFTGGPILSPDERKQRKVVTSTPVR